MNTCLVTGGAGFIGSHLVEHLIASGHTVRILDDLRTGRRKNLQAVQNHIDFRLGSITDPDTVLAAVQDCTWVFHLAALPSVSRSVEEPLASHAVCATGTLQVLEAARRAGRSPTDLCGQQQRLRRFTRQYFTYVANAVQALRRAVRDGTSRCRRFERRTAKSRNLTDLFARVPPRTKRTSISEETATTSSTSFRAGG